MRMYIGFPVEIPRSEWKWDRKHTENLHCTVAYWNDITTVRANKIANNITNLGVFPLALNYYSIVDKIYPDVMGPDGDVPVLRINMFPQHGNIQVLREHLCEKYGADDTYPSWNPHVTVSTPVAIHPPKQLIFKPVHMWRGNCPPHPIIRKD